MSELKTYWNGQAKYADLHSKLWDELVPGQGEAESVKGELVRCVGRLVYEYYNNGNCNAVEGGTITEYYQDMLDFIDRYTDNVDIDGFEKVMCESEYGYESNFSYNREEAYTQFVDSVMEEVKEMTDMIRNPNYVYETA